MQHKALESPISRIFGGKFRTVLKVPGARESAMIDPWSRLQLDIQVPNDFPFPNSTAKKEPIAGVRPYY